MRLMGAMGHISLIGHFSPILHWKRFYPAYECMNSQPIQEIKKSGNTYSRAFGTTIGSESLTTVFGMGTGVAFPKWSPERSGAPM